MITIFAIADGTDGKNHPYLWVLIAKNLDGLLQIVRTLIHCEFFFRKERGWTLLTIIHNFARFLQSIYVISAEGEKTDCVSRSFAPKLNIAEDPVCGSGHCHIVPYWTNVLNKTDIIAYQASARGGTLYCSLRKDKVIISGKATLFSESKLNIEK